MEELSPAHQPAHICLSLSQKSSETRQIGVRHSHPRGSSLSFSLAALRSSLASPTSLSVALLGPATPPSDSPAALPLR